MSFSDADLKTLMEGLHAKTWSIGPKVVLAIISRLDASERLNQVYRASYHQEEDTDDLEDVRQAELAWQKAAGK